MPPKKRGRVTRTNPREEEQSVANAPAPVPAQPAPMDMNVMTEAMARALRSVFGNQVPPVPPATAPAVPPVPAPATIPPAAAAPVATAAPAAAAAPQVIYVQAPPAVDPEEAEAAKRRRLFKDFMDTRPPKFSGDGSQHIVDWLQEVQEHMQSMECPADRKVAFAKSLLKEAAKNWWIQAERDDPGMDWDTFCRKIRQEFYPVTEERSRLSAFFSAGKQNKPVAEIVRQYNNELSYVSHMVPTEDQRICHLAQRLPEHVQDYAAGLRCATYRDYKDAVLGYAGRSTGPKGGSSLGQKSSGSKRPAESSSRFS